MRCPHPIVIRFVSSYFLLQDDATRYIIAKTILCVKNKNGAAIMEQILCIKLKFAIGGCLTQMSMHTTVILGIQRIHFVSVKAKLDTQTDGKSYPYVALFFACATIYFKMIFFFILRRPLTKLLTNAHNTKYFQ